MADLKFAASFQVFATDEKGRNKIESKLITLDGIYNARWDIDSKLLVLDYYPDQISSDEIHQQIASLGYDTELYKASRFIGKDYLK